jgi:hypothetical protein
MRKLTLKDERFEWGPEQDQSFETPKNILCSDLILAYPQTPDAEHPFIIELNGCI